MKAALVAVFFALATDDAPTRDDSKRKLWHGAPVRSLSFSPDGKRLAVAGQYLRLFDPATGKEDEERGIHHEGHMVYQGFLAVRYGKIITAINRNAVYQFDTTNGKQIRRFTAQKKWISCLAVSSDDRYIATGGAEDDAHENGTIRIFDAGTGKELRQLKGHGRIPQTLVFGKGRLASTDGRDIRIWDVATGKQTTRFEYSTSRHTTSQIDLAPDGGILAAVGRFEIRFFEISTGKRWSIKKDGVYFTAVAYSPDGSRLALAADDNLIRIWDSRSGRELKVLSGHEKDINVLAFSPDGKTLASGSDGESAFLWSLPAGGSTPDTAFTRAKMETRSDIHTMSFSPDGKILASGGGKIHLWDVASGAQYERLHEQFEMRHPKRVQFSADGSRFAAHNGDEIWIWNFASNERIRKIQEGDRSIHDVDLSPNGQRIAVAKDDALLVRDIATGKTIRTIQGASGEFRSTRFVPSGKKLVVVDDAQVRVFSTSGFRQLKKFRRWASEENGEVRPSETPIAISPDGRWLALPDSESIHLFDLTTGKGRELKGLDGNPRAFAFSPSGKSLVSGGEDEIVRLWSIGTGKQVRKFDVGSDVYEVACQPGGKLIAWGGDTEEVGLLTLGAKRKKPSPNGRR